MKIRRFAATLFAFSMIAAFAVPAGAVDLSEPAADNPNALSDAAGQTVQCKIVKFSDDAEPVDVILDVDIPDDATVAEEDMIVQYAIAEEAGIAPIDVIAARSNVVTPRDVLDLVSLKEKVTILPTGTIVGAGKIATADAILLIVELDHYTNNTGASSLSVTVTGGKNASANYTMNTDFSSYRSVVYMYTGQGGVFLTNGSNVSAKARTDKGSVQVQTCRLYVTNQYMGPGPV